MKKANSIGFAFFCVINQLVKTFVLTNNCSDIVGVSSPTIQKCCWWINTDNDSKKNLPPFSKQWTF